MSYLEALPIEIIQHIATHLTSTTDLYNLSYTSRKFHTAIQATQAVFRDLFLSTYDRPLKCDNYDFKQNYHWRNTTLDPFIYSTHQCLEPAKVTAKVTEAIPLTLEIIKGIRILLLETSTKNFDHLRRFAIKSHNLLPTTPETNTYIPYQLLMALQLVLTNIAATSRISWVDTTDGHAYSQAWAYGTGGHPLFHKNEIDASSLTRLWAISNFFLLHFSGRIQGLESRGLKVTFDELLGEERGAPGVWNSNLWVDSDVEMPKYWFGFYVYLEPEDIHHVHHTSSPMLTLKEDHFDGKLTIMELTTTATTFTGTGTDVDDFNVHGTITPLPPIFSIPGFRRVSFSNIYPDDHWLYEGCLLPGSQTIIGRWTTHEGDDHDPDTTPWEGPFIMWAVSREDYEYEKALRDDEGKEGEVDDFLNL